MPNTTVRATGEAMPAVNINRRRAMLGAGATAAALAVTTLPAEPAAADAELFQLGEEMETAHARWEQACKEQDAASERYEALKASFLGSQEARPEEPFPLPEKFRGLVYGKYLTVGDAHILEKVAPNHPLLIWHQEEMDRYKRLRAEQDGSLAKLSRAELEAADTAVETDTATLFAIAERVFAIPAATVAGMLVKIRVDQMQEVYGEDEISEDAMASIAADIKRMAGGVS